MKTQGGAWMGRMGILGIVGCLGVALAALGIAVEPAYAQLGEGRDGGGGALNTRLEFAVPEGWRDLSPGAPPHRFEGVPSQAADAARSGAYRAMAIDMDNLDAGIAANMTAAIVPGSVAIDADLIAGLAADWTDSMLDEGYRVDAQSQVVLGGVAAGKIEASSIQGGVPIQQLVYILPGPSEMGILTFTATKDSFAGYRPIFEATAEKTKGLVLRAQLETGIPKTALAILAAGLILAFWLVRRLQKPEKA